MEAGKLRRRASLQRQQVSQDAFGAQLVTWVEFARPAARLEEIQGREFLAALGQGTQGELTHRVTLRYRDDVLAEDRVVIDGRSFDVIAARSDEKRTVTVLMCKELVA